MSTFRLGLFLRCEVGRRLVDGLGLRFEGLGFMVQKLEEFRVWGSGFGI